MAAGPRLFADRWLLSAGRMLMGIRWKLLILLLTIALLPLVFVAVLDRRGVLALGEQLGAEARAALTERTFAQLRQLIRDHATLIRHQRNALETTLRAQARAVEQRLAAEKPESRAVYFDEAYADPAQRPSDLTESPRHRRYKDHRAEGGAAPVDNARPADGGSPMQVSWDEQVYVLAPGVKREDVAEDIARLSSMPAEYRFLKQAHPDLIYWQVTSLQNGLHTSYPGHGGYPDGFDPRDRPWYQVPRQRGRLVWIGPYYDASSEERILTVAMPVRRPNGSFAGVTAIDVTVADVVAGMKLPDLAAFAARSMLVLVKPDPDSPSRRRAAVIARPGIDPESRRWSTQLAVEWLESDDPEMTDELIADLSKGQFGDLRAPYRGEDSLWAYGPVDDEGAFLVAIVPFDTAVAQAIAAEKDALERTWAQLGATGAVAGLVILIVVLCALVGSRQVTEPIRRLVATADRIARGELDARAQVLSNDEFGRLAHDFNAMVPKLKERLELKQSLNLAMEVQQNLLPHSPPNVDGFDVAGKSIYCDETGGDYYDYLDLSTIGPRRLGIVVGDVTGHGVAAAMLMTTGRALLRSRAAASNGDLKEMLSSLNRILDADMGDDRFMTLFYMVLDSDKLEARWATAGHDAAVTYDPAIDEFGELAGCDLPLGIDPDWVFTEHPPLQLSAGQIVVIGTDGIWEARNPERKFFGKDALREVIRANAAGSASEICDAITDAVARFRRGRPQEDDVTLVVIKVTAMPRQEQSSEVLVTGDSVTGRIRASGDGQT